MTSISPHDEQQGVPHPSGATSENQEADQKLLTRYSENLTGVFGTPSRVLVRGEGSFVWDADGNRYLDLLAGIAVNSLGHNHPALVSAVTEQISTLGHISNLFTSEPQIRLAERLLERAQAPEGSTVFFANSGGEANEAAFKIARRYGNSSGGQRRRIITLVNGFHGRTMGAMTMTWKPQYKEPFAPLLSGVEHVLPGDIEALRETMDDTVAAVVIEPVQGEAGVHGYPEGYLQAARDLCDEYGALLIFDEVQTGIGRTGTWFAHQNPRVTGQQQPVVPDAMTVAKGLGGGVPVGALISMGEGVSSLMTAGQHGTTFGGNPLATSAGLAVVDTIERDGLLQHVQTVSETICGVLESSDLVEDVRAYGLLIGIDLKAPEEEVPGGIAPAVVKAGLDAGYILNATGPNTLRIAPPLTIPADEVEAAAHTVVELVQSVSNNASSHSVKEK